MAAGLTWLSVWQADWRAIAGSLAGTSWRWVLAACVLVVIDRAVNAYRWIALLQPVTPRPSVSALMRIFFISTFVGTFLPSTVGSDAVRAWSLAQDQVSRSQSIASVLVDRLLGLVSTLLTALVGCALMPMLLSNLGAALTWALALTTAVSVLSLAVVFSPGIDAILRRHLGVVPARLRSSAGRLLDALQAYRTERRLMMLVLAASVGVQVLRVVQAWMLGLSLGIAAPLTAYVAFIPVIVLVMLLPVTMNGLGTGQLAFVWMFRLAGVGAAEAFALSVLFAGLGIVGNLPGALLYAVGPSPPRR